MSDVMTPEQRSRAMSHIKRERYQHRGIIAESPLAQGHPIPEEL